MKQVSIQKFIFRIIPQQQVNIGCAMILAQLDGGIKRSFSEEGVHIVKTRGASELIGV